MAADSRFGVYLPPLLEALGMAQLEHNPRHNRMRAPYPEAVESLTVRGVRLVSDASGD